MQFTAAFIAFVASVSAHAAMIAAVGNGDTTVMSRGFGVLLDTPRDGTTREPFQKDSSIIRDREISAGGSPCGRTNAGGPNNMDAMVSAATAGPVARVTSTGGVLTMTMHQVNGDGAGPYSCDWSADGKTFTPMEVTTNVPGENSRSRARAQDFPLVANVPNGAATALGPNNNQALVRCRNAARAGPFGACVLVQKD